MNLTNRQKLAAVVILIAGLAAFTAPFMLQAPPLQGNQGTDGNSNDNNGGTGGTSGTGTDTAPGVGETGGGSDEQGSDDEGDDDDDYDEDSKDDQDD